MRIGTKSISLMLAVKIYWLVFQIDISELESRRAALELWLNQNHLLAQAVGERILVQVCIVALIREQCPRGNVFLIFL
jgi:hypothetical protein